MASCFICEMKFGTCGLLKEHLTRDHRLGENDPVTCPQCDRTYTFLSTFCKHVRSHEKSYHHLSSTPDIPVSSNMETETFDHDELDFVQDVRNDCEKMDTDCPSLEDFPSVLKDQVATLVARMYNHPTVPNNLVQSIIYYFMDFIKTSVKGAVRATRDVENPLLHYLSSVENAFLPFKTEYRTIKHFKEKGHYKEPEPVWIGNKKKYYGDVNSKGTTSLYKEIYAEHVPLSWTLSKFFELPGVLEDTLKFMNNLAKETGVLSNFIQGSLWKKMTSKSKGLTLPLFIFSDEFQAKNGLGSHSNSQKLTGTYASIPCLPPEYSSLKNIFLTFMFNAKDRKPCGNKAVFEALINELINLQSNGITVKTKNSEVKLFFKLALLLADNLGLHQLLGLNESFTCNYPCLNCKIDIHTLRSLCVEDELLLRNSTNYLLDVQENDASSTGIKELCVWHRIDGFHLSENSGLDLMHDALQGVCDSDLFFIIQHFLDAKQISVNILVERINNFDYGPVDKKNKPPDFAKVLKKDKISLSAGETLCLLRYLGLIIGDLVPESDDVWSLYIALRKIMDLLLSPVLKVESVHAMKILIQEHHDLFLTLTGSHLTSKFHNFTHYPGKFLKLGPLVNLWVMPFEASHKQYKESAHSTSCTKNLSLTLSKKKQFQTHYSFLIGDSGKKTLSCGKGQNVIVSSLPFFKEFRHLIPNSLNPSDSVFLCSWVEIIGTKYKSPMVLVAEILDDRPSFVMIDSIFVYNDKEVFFFCRELLTVSFSEHFYAYHVYKTDCFNILRYEDLNQFHTLGLSQAKDGQHYVTLRHTV